MYKRQSEFFVFPYYDLSNDSTGSGRLVLPVSRKLSGGTVVTSQSVDSRFDQNQTEFGVLVLAITFQVLTNLDGLLDKHVKILGNFWGKTVGLKDTNDLLSSDRLHLGNTIGIPKNHTNLRWSQSLLGKLADVFLNIVGGDLKPRRRRALVWEGSLGDCLLYTSPSPRD